MHRLFMVCIGVVVLVSTASASVPPVGKLPVGPVAKLQTSVGQLFAVALPGNADQALGWRIARPYDTRVVRGVDEADVGANVVVTYRAVGPGTTRVVYALTRNETPKALEARTLVVAVARR